jgi:sugar lactone lactonase YvrE
MSAAANTALDGLLADLGLDRCDSGGAIHLVDDDPIVASRHRPVASIFAYDFDADDGTIRNRRLFASTSGLGGLPDGATVDADGHYWCALFGGGAVARFDAAGRLVARYGLPVKNPTMCAFGDKDLDTLYVTSARALMTEAELAEQPLAGALLALTRLGVQGLAEPTFAG